MEPLEHNYKVTWYAGEGERRVGMFEFHEHLDPAIARYRELDAEGRDPTVYVQQWCIVAIPDLAREHTDAFPRTYSQQDAE